MVDAGQPLPAAVFAVGLAAVHLYGSRLERFVATPERALSFAGGASIAYVIVLILPEVNEAVLTVIEREGATGAFLQREEEVYVVVLIGLLTFYGVHVLVSRRGQENPGTSDTVFWFHTLSFAAYNALIGYLLFHQEEPGLSNLFFYAVAMGLHFLVQDTAFRRHHGGVYDRVGRWVLSAAVLLGAVVGATTEVGEIALGLLFAFLAGSIIFNVVKEELPEPEESRFATFLLGAALYTVVLFLT